MSTGHFSRRIEAPRERVYLALISESAIPQWKFPDGMTCRVLEFDGREGGGFRISLSYDAPGHAGKTSEHTDIYHGRFAKLVPNEQVVEIDEFETDDPALQGEMTITYTLSDAREDTNLVATHEGLPRGVSKEDNDAGWTMALQRLAELLEGDRWLMLEGFAPDERSKSLKRRRLSMLPTVGFMLVWGISLPSVIPLEGELRPLLLYALVFLAIPVWAGMTALLFPEFATARPRAIAIGAAACLPFLGLAPFSLRAAAGTIATRPWMMVLVVAGTTTALAYMLFAFRRWRARA
jgi:uncharacterized protein YndB with AHSA1/START domain